jgi:hypothetical protein
VILASRGFDAVQKAKKLQTQVNKKPREEKVMLISLCAVIIAVLLEFFTPLNHTFDPLYLVPLLLVGGTTVLLATLFLMISVLNPLEHLEQKLVPNVIELVRRDSPLALSRFFLFLFPFLSYTAVVASLLLEVPHQKWLLLGWIVALGISLGLLRDSWHRVVNFLNPFHFIHYLSQEAKKACQNEQDEALWGSLDGLAEIGLRSIEKSKLALSTQVLQAFPPIMHTFFSSSKSIAHSNQDAEVEKKTGLDEASYTIFYLLQRLELLNDKALQHRLETVCRQMVMIMGKIIVYSAEFDLSMVTFPTHFLSKFGLKAQQHHFDEVAVLTTSTLLEVANAITTTVDLHYTELQEPFQAIINGLAALARETFKKDKHTNFKVLVQPLVDLKSFFQTEKMAQHPDTPVIIQETDRVLGEFEVLEQVMQSIPSVSDLTSSEGSSLDELPPRI